MGLWQLDGDTLAGGRFVVSAGSETVSCLLALERALATNPAERDWRDAHLGAYRAHLAANPLAALLMRTALGVDWTADFLTATPLPGATVEEEIESVRRTPVEQAYADLAFAARHEVPEPLRRANPGRLAADLLAWVWREAVEPYWPRRRRILEADVVYRTTELSRGGWAAALGGMRPGMRWLGESRLQINTLANPPRDATGKQLLFAPVTVGRGFVSWGAHDRFAIIYPCAGVLADPSAEAPRALGRLLGTARAHVLMLLAGPMSTTQLVALTGQGLGSVGRHLKVLLEAGLVARRRSGRSVLYYRSEVGEALVSASTGAP